MNITDELQKLGEMRQQGLLTDQEFSIAKTKLLAQDASEAALKTSPAGPALSPVSKPTQAKTYRSSRWSAHNLFFPDSVVLANDGILFRKGGMFRSNEEHIAYHSIASIRVRNGLFLSSLSVETSGGSQPIFVNGLWKSDAREIQDAIRAHEARI